MKTLGLSAPNPDKRSALDRFFCKRVRACSKFLCRF